MKKSISLALSLAIIFTAFLNVFLISGNALDFPQRFDEACSVLDMTDVIPKELNTYSLEVSRGDFVIFASHLLNIVEYGEMTEQYYFDVPNGHWAGNSVNSLTKMGALTPSDNKMFRPDDIITYEEACKVTLSILGYDVYANAQGGYPAGYIAVAARLKLNDGVDARTNMTLADTIMMLYNASLTETAEIASLGDSIEYSPKGGKTLLSIYKNIDVIEGRLEGNAGTYVNNILVHQNKVLIDDKIYDYSGQESDAYLGCEVRAYLRNLDTVPEVVYIASDLQYPQIRTVNVDKNYIGYNKSARKLVISAEGSKEISYSIDNSAIVLKNKQHITANISLAFDIKAGNINMVDSDLDGDYDFILINEYKNYVVGYVDSTNEVIIDKYDTSKSVDFSLDTDKIIRIIDEDGIQIDFSSIIVGNIVSVFESDYLIYAIVSNKAISGAIEEYSDEENEGYINGIWYEFTDDANKNVTFLLGTSYVFYLDAYGKVADIGKRKSDSNFLGYVTSYFEDENDAGRLKLKIFDQESVMGIYGFENSVKIDQKSCKEDDEILKALKLGKDTIAGQLIVFSLSKEGLLKTIDTVHPSNYEDEDTLFVNAPFEKRQYLYNSNTFGRTVIANSDTVIFGVPLDSKLENADDDDFALLNLSYFTSSEDYDVEAYKTVNDNGFEDAIVCFGDIYKQINNETDLFLVDKIKQGLNGDGDIVEVVTGYLGGESKTITTQSGYSLENNGVASGDIIRLSLSYKGEAINYEMIYDYSLKTAPTWAPTYNSQFNMLFNVTCAYPYSCNNGVLKVDYEGDGVYDEVGAIANTKIVVYDSTQRDASARKGDLSDISDYVSTGKFSDRVFIRGRYAVYNWMIIYK